MSKRKSLNISKKQKSLRKEMNKISNRLDSMINKTIGIYKRVNKFQEQFHILLNMCECKDPTIKTTHTKLDETKETNNKQLVDAVLVTPSSPTSQHADPNILGTVQLCEGDIQATQSSSLPITLPQIANPPPSKIQRKRAGSGGKQAPRRRKKVHTATARENIATTSVVRDLQPEFIKTGEQ
jgi:hypothetical protein